MGEYGDLDLADELMALRADNARLLSRIENCEKAYVCLDEIERRLRAENARLQQLNCQLIRKDESDEVVGVLLEAFGALKKLAALHRQQVNPSPETMDKIEDLIAAADEIVARAAMGESDG